MAVFAIDANPDPTAGVVPGAEVDSEDEGVLPLTGSFPFPLPLPLPLPLALAAKGLTVPVIPRLTLSASFRAFLVSFYFLYSGMSQRSPFNIWISFSLLNAFIRTLIEG